MTCIPRARQLPTGAAEIEHLKLRIAKLRRMQFGRKSEKLDRQLEQLEPRLEDLQADEGQTASRAQRQRRPFRAPAQKKPLPAHLPREEQAHAPAEDACPSCGGALKHLGEDVSEQLEFVPARFKVIRHVRPFAGPLAPSSQRQAIVILNTMFSWLVNAGYLAGNPLSLSRQRARRAKPRITRYIEADLWAVVKMTIDQMPKETDREREHYFRLRWLFSLLYLCGLRISEVVGNAMAGFFCRRDRDGEERWWLEITGKGDKTRIVPATNELMVELARYRREKGLAPLPLPGEALPLLLPIGERKEPMTRGTVHAIVKKVFAATATRLRQRGEDYHAIADRVEQASAHWLRHTAGSHMANNAVDLRHVRDNLGHESISTTSHYLHADDDARHRETEERHKIGW
ncbi:MAG TPA: tyrosine-type recombinase/integrase [Noviherbaspirillum sp.]